MKQPHDYPTYEAWLADQEPAPTLNTSHEHAFPVRSEQEPEGRYPSRAYWEYKTSEAYLSGRDERMSTAQRWCLHLRVTEDDAPPTEQHPAQVLADRIIATGHPTLTGEYIGGDSFGQWAEAFPSWPEDDHALHIYLTAPNVDIAIEAAREICRAAGEPYTWATNATLSTGGDWAEQAEVWDPPPWSQRAYSGNPAAMTQTQSSSTDQITFTVTRSAGADGAYLVMVDTNFEPNGKDGKPGVRILLNDHPVFEDVSFEQREDGQMHQYTDRRFTVDMSTIIDTGLTD